VKQLREKTTRDDGLQARLVESGGDLAKAEAILRTKGVALRQKSRARNEGKASWPPTFIFRQSRRARRGELRDRFCSEE